MIQNNKSEIEQLKRKFKQKTKEIQSLFFSDITKSKRLVMNIDEYLKILFKKLESIVSSKMLTNFHQYLLDQFNIPIQINLKFLRYDQFMALFQQWISFVQTKHLYIVQSVTQQSFEQQFRNQKFNQIIKLKSNYINQYAQALSPHKRFSDFDFNQLLRQIFLGYFLYQYKVDDQIFFNKINSFTELMSLLTKYRQSQRKQRLFDDPKFIYVKEIPKFFKFWQDFNLQLQIEDEERKFLINQSTQTQDLKQQYQQNQSLEQILNEIIKKLTVKKKQIYQNQIMQDSIQKILNFLKKQRTSLYPTSKKQKIGFWETKETTDTKFTKIQNLEQKPLKLNDTIRVNKKLERLAGQIYNYYLHKSKSGGYDDKQLELQQQPRLDTKKIYNFLQDIDILKYFQYPRSMKLIELIRNNISNPNEIVFQEFFSFVNQLLLNQQQFTLMKIEKFVQNHIKEKMHIQIYRNKKTKKFITEMPQNVLDRGISKSFQSKQQQSYVKNQSIFTNIKKSIPLLSLQKSSINNNNISNKRYLRRAKNESSAKKNIPTLQVQYSQPKKIESSAPNSILHNQIKDQIYDKQKIKYNIYSNLGIRKQ